MSALHVHNLKAEIESLLRNYLSIQSFSSTIHEKAVEPFFMNYFQDLDYFHIHPEHLGLFPIEDDPYQRQVCWAMIRGSMDQTVVLLHHYDVVGIEDYKHLQEVAFSPEQLTKELRQIIDSLTKEVAEDLLSDDYIFGHGACDMKGGGAIQMALLKQYSLQSKVPGNIILIAVPDEENLSAGMRSAALLLEQLKEKYHLDYKMMINSEPHQRKSKKVGVLSEGSIGKLMPFIYVRGYLSHVGKVFEGLNPLHVLSTIATRIELNMDFSEVVGQEPSPPPTWLYLKDSKKQYDVSMPLSSYGCFSVLTLHQTPADILNKVKDICLEAFASVISKMNLSYEKFLLQSNRNVQKLPWEPNVVSFQTLYDEATANHGQRFTDAYKQEILRLKKLLQQDQLDLIRCNYELIDFVYGFIEDLSPRVIYGLIPPYYPSVSNLYFDAREDSMAKTLGAKLISYAKETFQEPYEIEYFFTGISDLSYTSIVNSREIQTQLKESMPLFGEIYQLPLKSVEKISMPCINIGPWGKDFHKLTERVLKKDLFEITPQLIHYAICKLLE